MDSDAAKIVGEVIFRTLTDHDRLVINYLAEHASINVSETQRLTALTWPMAKRLLTELAKRGVLEDRRRKHLRRDPLARFILKKPR